MHRYYIHVLSALLHHSSLYSVYEIRHPFPPYATHYAIMLGLTHFVSYNLAEKLLVIGILFCFAYGFRFCALGMGKAGNALSFFVAPLLLNWALMYGFFNYSLALGLFLFIAGCWHRASLGSRRYWIPFLLLVSLLTFTHPVPLLILAGLCLMDVLIRALLLRGRAKPLGRLDLVFCCCALIFCLVADRVPAASLQQHAIGSIFSGFGIFPRRAAQEFLLAGISPYYTRAHGLLPNLYRLQLYLVMMCAVFLGWRSFRSHWRERSLRFSDTFLVCTALLSLAILTMPDVVNGSAYFSMRMVTLLWIGALLAASGGEFRRPGTIFQIQGTAILFACITLITAECMFRPLADALQTVQGQPVPSKAQGLLLVGTGLDDYVHHHYEVEFDPLGWGPVLAFSANRDVLVDSPWIDQEITPIEAKPGSPIMINDVRLTHMSKTDPGFIRNACLPRSQEQTLTHEATFLLYADTPGELAQGLAEQFMPADAAHFRCTHRSWYLFCVAR